MSYCPECGEKIGDASETEKKLPKSFPKLTRKSAGVLASTTDELKTRYPNHFIFIQAGYFFEIIGPDAEECNRLFGWKVATNWDRPYTGVPINAQQFKKILRANNQPYVIVMQKQREEEKGKIDREITEIYPDKR